MYSILKTVFLEVAIDRRDPHDACEGSQWHGSGRYDSVVIVSKRSLAVPSQRLRSPAFPKVESCGATRPRKSMHRSAPPSPAGGVSHWVGCQIGVDSCCQLRVALGPAESVRAPGRWAKSGGWQHRCGQVSAQRRLGRASAGRMRRDGTGEWAAAAPGAPAPPLAGDCGPARGRCGVQLADWPIPHRLQADGLRAWPPAEDPSGEPRSVALGPSGPAGRYEGLAGLRPGCARRLREGGPAGQGPRRLLLVLQPVPKPGAGPPEHGVPGRDRRFEGRKPDVIASHTTQLWMSRGGARPRSVGRHQACACTLVHHTVISSQVTTSSTGVCGASRASEQTCQAVTASNARHLPGAAAVRRRRSWMRGTCQEVCVFLLRLGGLVGNETGVDEWGSAGQRQAGGNRLPPAGRASPAGAERGGRSRTGGRAGGPQGRARGAPREVRTESPGCEGGSGTAAGRKPGGLTRSLRSAGRGPSGRAAPSARGDRDSSSAGGGAAAAGGPACT